MKYSIQLTEQGLNDFYQQSISNQFFNTENLLVESERIDKPKNSSENYIFSDQNAKIIELKSDNLKQRRPSGPKRGKKNVVDWTTDQDKLLFQKYTSEGSKWVLIAEFFPSKSDNDVKNRFYCCIRKVLKKVNEYQMRGKVKPKKLISFDCLLTYLQITKFNQKCLDGRFSQIKKKMEQILEVRRLIFDMSLKPDQQIESEEVGVLVSKLLDLKYTLKFINIKRVKKSAQKGEPWPSAQFQAQKEEANDSRLKINTESQNFGKVTQHQHDAKKRSDDFFDIQRLEQELFKKSCSPNRSLIQQCSGILWPLLKESQENDKLCFML